MPADASAGELALDAADLVIPRRLRTTIPEEFRGRRVFAFAGLADNEQFFASLRELGLEAVRSGATTLEELRRVGLNE